MRATALSVTAPDMKLSRQLTRTPRVYDGSGSDAGMGRDRLRRHRGGLLEAIAVLSARPFVPPRQGAGHAR